MFYQSVYNRVSLAKFSRKPSFPKHFTGPCTNPPADCTSTPITAEFVQYAWISYREAGLRFTEQNCRFSANRIFAKKKRNQQNNGCVRTKLPYADGSREIPRFATCFKKPLLFLQIVSPQINRKNENKPRWKETHLLHITLILMITEKKLLCLKTEGNGSWRPVNSLSRLSTTPHMLFQSQTPADCRTKIEFVNYAHLYAKLSIYAYQQRRSQPNQDHR